MRSRRFKIITRAGWKRLAGLGIVLVIAIGVIYLMMIRMPGKSYRGDLPALTADQSILAVELRRDVQMLAGTIGRRNVFHPDGYRAAAEFLEGSLVEAGYTVEKQQFQAFDETCVNLEVEIKGAKFPDQIIVIGAHYDSVDDSPAANDNGSGVAAALALARRLNGAASKDGPPSLAPRAGRFDRTIRFVLFANEEPPHFQTEEMGSLVYARQCKERGEKIVGMLSLETIGYYSDAPASQTYPIGAIGWLYPDTGNFIGFVGNYSSRKLVRRSIKSFRNHAQFPSEGAALPGWITGVGWSDHWAFWQVGYPALMVTDTAPFRYPHYHTAQDTPDKLDYERMARVVEGLRWVIGDLAGETAD